MIKAAATTTLQWLTRLILGAILLPVICCAFAVFSVVAACSDRQWLRPRRSRAQEWIPAHPEAAVAGASFPE